jgi:hypothetical protein
MESTMEGGENGTTPSKAGCTRTVVGVGLGTALGALAGIVAGLVAGVSIALILSVL